MILPFYTRQSHRASPTASPLLPPAGAKPHGSGPAHREGPEPPRRSRTVRAHVKMAAPSLLGCGRVATRKVLRLEARGLRGAAPSAALCTRPAGSGTPPTQTTAAAQPAPEEFDNSTYKNLQHHEYNIYTFADSVAVLSKFRQPQPSSGRPSPRH
ncbi:NADH dehydrogenase [ubiquinone] flavoprotein 3, mitochondrial isoform X2 [Falco biarmicus]|uniref:NADH dehydrogenase [ubiquinone] flavoprotein 3, mitochondrial isoform X2 n=1 Tax=Falco biarmicus TaxID=345155 RepID=UPI0024BC7547|nr:NADH dehydrogenase [ubiquinone] flavoprotein 3, mitochondrial isoform X2 [Falco biarmicus]